MNKLNASSTTRRQLGGKITRAFVFWTITGLISSRSHGYQEKNVCLFGFFLRTEDQSRRKKTKDTEQPGARCGLLTVLFC